MAELRPKVCMLPYRKKLGWRPSQMLLSDLQWPLGVPSEIDGQTLADLLPTDHLLIHPHSTLYFRPSFGTEAQVSLVIQEPRAIHRRHMTMAQLFHRRFHRILTSDSHLMASLPNAVFFPVGGSWVPDWRGIDLTKRAMCSLIASGKKKQIGHKLRHELVTWARKTDQNIAIMGRGYQPFLNKSDGLAPFRYSVVIENTREKGYFTEKLIDAFLCNTVPIYWGSPNISDFFDTDAMMVCENLTDIQCAIEKMSLADYASRLPALAAARQAAAGYMDINLRAAQTVLGEA
ncbi:glycosyltransferase family 10 domain-containing protein [Pseudorhodobacter ferrugineus]|uniref:glycosyltransferase family 10 domain-containing protein n=1 Tax=Pseudorhodobacter ferrugineus TaxID=77008 RepID=UPI000524C101|nr:glycosyltransferase family 10 [Pseudorhodobacter ferrugineus]